MKSLTMMAVVCAISALMALPCVIVAGESEQMREKQQFVLRPIGSVHKAKGRTTLVVKKNLQPALKGLDGFSHVWVFWWFNRSDTGDKRATLQVHPRGNRDNPLTGVFACRAPVRPNLIGLTLCRVVSVKNNVVEVDKIDAFTDTPILDIKPYIPATDLAEGSVPNWLKDR
jgi:tRNA-Thr(GGU) m(6)t(6)A37 methyltransferase TsaA